MLCIGIDPGTHTGFAVWDTRQGAFLRLETLPLHRALDEARKLALMCRDEWRESVQVVFEDARQRKWYGTGNANAKLQGAGSVKRDCAIWEAMLKDYGIPYIAKAPVKGATKVSADYFRTISGWQERTTEHSRDAAMLVIGR